MASLSLLPDDSPGKTSRVRDCEVESHTRRPLSRTERDKSLYDLLQTLEPSLLSAPTDQDHVALSKRGLVVMSLGAAAFWYSLRLVIRDSLLPKRWQKSPRRSVLELYLLATIHSGGWLLLSGRKLVAGKLQNPKYVQRALCLSVGYYLHDLLALRDVFAAEPLMFLNQLTAFICTSSVLMAKGVSFLVPSMMLGQLPNFFLSLLRVVNILKVYVDDRVLQGLFSMWLTTFVATKGLGVPMFALKHFYRKPVPALFQPALRPARFAFLVYMIINQMSLARALRNLPAFLNTGVQNPGNASATSKVVVRFISVGIMSSLIAPLVIAPLSLPGLLIACKRGSKPARIVVSLAGAALAVDQILPLPKKPSKLFVKMTVPFFGFLMRGYFDCDVVQEGELYDHDRRYLFAVFPHGFAPMTTGTLQAHLFEQGITTTTFGASVLFRIPIIGRMLCMYGVQSASAKNLNASLRAHNATLLFPGGIAEMFFVRPDIEQVMCQSRKGFVEQAMRTGADIVPVYLLGNTRIYDTAPPGSLAHRFLERLSRTLRMSIVPFRGLGGSPMPFPKKNMVLVGKPIATGIPNSKPSEVEIDTMHKRFFGELKELYDRHRALVPGFEKRELYLEGMNPRPPRRPPSAPLASYTQFPSLTPRPSQPNQSSRL